MADSETPEPARKRKAEGDVKRDRWRLGASTKIALAVIPAVAAVLAAVLAAIISRNPGTESANGPPTALSSAARGIAPLPTPDCAGCKSGTTYPEQAGNVTPKTFRDPRSFVGIGKELHPLQRVDVLCKLYAPSAPSVGDYWYLVVSPPWNGRYYSPSNSFRGGDDPNGNGSTAVDLRVPDC
ncbi:MAG: hypothetical protein ACRDQ5_21130 [Sciscionella sp.]